MKIILKNNLNVILVRYFVEMNCPCGTCKFTLDNDMQNRPTTTFEVSLKFANTDDWFSLCTLMILIIIYVYLSCISQDAGQSSAKGFSDIDFL